MKKILLTITDELYDVLEAIQVRVDNPKEYRDFSTVPVFSGESGRNAMIERILRSHPAVDLLREELGIEWQDRGQRGRPVVEKSVKKTTKKKSSKPKKNRTDAND